MDESTAVLAKTPSSDVGAESLVSEDEKKAVSTHVLVEEEQIGKLRALSRRTRIAQSEYLREAVDDLLVKYVTNDLKDAVK